MIKKKVMISKYFSVRELSCRCRSKSCDAYPISPELLQVLDNIREDYGDPITITSGVRCKTWNDKVNGSPKSQHLLGKAVDILMHEKEIKRFISICKNNGIVGIGIGNGWLHIDIRDGMNTTWFY